MLLLLIHGLSRLPLSSKRARRKPPFSSSPSLILYLAFRGAAWPVGQLSDALARGATPLPAAPRFTFHSPSSCVFLSAYFVHLGAALPLAAAARVRSAHISLFPLCWARAFDASGAPFCFCLYFSSLPEPVFHMFRPAGLGT